MKIRDIILGFAIGDAMGVPIEFMTREYLSKHPTTEMTGYGSYEVPKGCWSDDTSMVLATMDSIIKSEGINYNHIADCFCDWVNNSKYTPTSEIFDIGNTTKEAIIKYWNQTHPGNGHLGIDLPSNKEVTEVDATKCGGISSSSNGNGSLMRILPLVFYLKQRNTNELETYQIIKNISSITHAHEISILGCYIYVNYALNLLNKESKEEAYEQITKLNYDKYFSTDTITLYQRIINKELISLDIDSISSSGYVVDTLEAVLFVIMTTNNYKEAVIKAINLGKDTDTIGALVGGLAAIIYGFKDIPESWLKDLKRREYIEDISDSYQKVLVYINRGDGK